MVSLSVVFWMYVIFFAMIGAMRGWAKELLVSFSVVLSLFLITVMETLVPGIKDILKRAGEDTVFWFRAIMVISMVFFGYQTPNLKAIAPGKFARERLQDTLLGFILGALNGYMIVGTMWWFMDDAGYPFDIITKPAESAQALISRLPPAYLYATNWIYFAVGLAFVFVLVVFI